MGRGPSQRRGFCPQPRKSRPGLQAVSKTQIHIQCFLGTLSPAFAHAWERGGVGGCEHVPRSLLGWLGRGRAVFAFLFFCLSCSCRVGFCFPLSLGSPSHPRSRSSLRKAARAFADRRPRRAGAAAAAATAGARPRN